MNIEQAFRNKKRIENEISMLQSKLNKLFSDRKELKFQITQTDDFHSGEELTDRLLNIEQELRETNSLYNDQVNELEQAEAKFGVLKTDFLSKHYSEVQKRWDKLQELAKQADQINAELTEMGEYAHRYTGMYSVTADPFHRNLAESEKNLEKLKRYAIPA